MRSDARLRLVLGPEVRNRPAPPAPSLPIEVAGRAVTVVVATRDRPDPLAGCIDSFFAGRVIPDRLVMVDNGLASGPWRYLRRRHHAQRQAVG